jgi:hypothetical protein
VVLKRSGLLVYLIVFERTILCVAFLREMLQVPPQQDAASDHLHLGDVDLPREDFKRAYSWFKSRLEEAVAAEDYLFR